MTIDGKKMLVKILLLYKKIMESRRQQIFKHNNHNNCTTEISKKNGRWKRTTDKESLHTTTNSRSDKHLFLNTPKDQTSINALMKVIK